MKHLAIVFALALLASGCARMGNSTQQTYFPGCYRPLQQANQLDDTARNIGVGAGKGLLVGTLAGLAGGAVSALFTGNALNIVSGAAIGAAGGAVAGGVTGGMENRDAQKNSLMAEWIAESGGETQGMGFNQAAATMSLQCYKKQATKIENDLKLGLITEQAAMPMLTEIRAGQQEAYTLFSTAN